MTLHRIWILMGTYRKGHLWNGSPYRTWWAVMWKRLWLAVTILLLHDPQGSTYQKNFHLPNLDISKICPGQSGSGLCQALIMWSNYFHLSNLQINFTLLSLALRYLESCLIHIMSLYTFQHLNFKGVNLYLWPTLNTGYCSRLKKQPAWGYSIPGYFRNIC